MKFSTKNKFILLGLLVVINIAIRLPVTAHALGVDTFYVFSLAESISTFGSARWILNPASFFGVYPYSYPSAFIFILSGLSQTTGISMDYIILLIGMILGISGVFFMFLLAKEVWNNDLYAFLAAFAYSLSFNMVKFTFWQASTRSLFIALFPLFLLILLKYRKSIKNLILLSVIFFIILASSHRVSFLLPIIIIVFCAVILLSKIYSKIKLRFVINPAIFQIHIFYILLMISLVLFTVQFLNVGPFKVNDFYSGFFFQGNDFISTFLNMGADYTSKMGLILFFVIPGMIAIISKLNKQFNQTFVILGFIAFLPLLGYENYSSVFIGPFFILVSAFGFITIFHFFSKKRGLAHLMLFSFIVLSIVFVIFMIEHTGVYKETTMSEKSYVSAQFIKLKANSTIISRDGDMASKLTAYSTKPTIPLGGPYAIAQPPGQIIFGFVTKQDLIIRPLTLSEFNPTVDEFWVASNTSNAKNEWVQIMKDNYWNEGPKNMLSKYKANLVITVGESRNYWYWSERYSPMLESLLNSGNKIYVNGVENIYSVKY